MLGFTLEFCISNKMLNNCEINEFITPIIRCTFGNDYYQMFIIWVKKKKRRGELRAKKGRYFLKFIS